MRPKGSCSSIRTGQDFSTDGPCYSWNLDLTGGFLVDLDEERIQLISLLGHLGGFGFGLELFN